MAETYTVRGRAQIGAPCPHCEGSGTLWEDSEVEEIITPDDETSSEALAEQALDNWAQRNDCTDWGWLRPPEIEIGAQPSPARVMAASGATSLFDLVPMAAEPAPADLGECAHCGRRNTLHTYQPAYAPHRPPQRLCADCYNRANMAAEDRLQRAAPDLLRACRLVLTRLDLEAAEHPGATFPAAALRSDLRAAITLAIGEEVI